MGVTRNVSSRSKSARLLKATGPRRGAGNGGNNGNTGGRGPTGAARRNKFRVKSQGRNVQAADFQVEFLSGTLRDKTIGDKLMYKTNEAQ